MTFEGRAAEDQRYQKTLIQCALLTPEVYGRGAQGGGRGGPGHLHGEVDDPLDSHKRAQLRHLPSAATRRVSPHARPHGPDAPPPVRLCAGAPRHQPVNRCGARLPAPTEDQSGGLRGGRCGKWMRANGERILGREAEPGGEGKNCFVKGAWPRTRGKVLRGREAWPGRSFNE